MRSLFSKISAFAHLLVPTFAIFICGCSRDAPSPVVLKIDDSNDITTGPYSELVSNVSSAKSNTLTHRVEEDETMFDVAYKYNIDPMNLAKINNIKPPYRVQEGRILKLPSGNSVSGDIPPDDGVVVLSDYDSSASDGKKLEQVGNEIPGFDNEPPKKPFNPSPKDEFNDRFEKIMATDSPKDAAKVSKKGVGNPNDDVSEKTPRGSSFNEQAAVLSIPKITKAADGSSLKDKAKTGDKQASDGDQQQKSGKSQNSPETIVRSKTATTTEKAKEQEVSSASAAKLKRPLEGTIISNFGDNSGGVPNDGINIKAKLGSSVHAAAKGKVIYVGNNLEEDFGNLVIVQHDNGLITTYSHLKDICVKKDSMIDANTKIGTVGKTGDVSEPQLHFEVMEGKKPVDPRKYMK